MKKLFIALILITFAVNFTFAASADTETSMLSARWLTGNIGAYNLPMPLKLEFSGKKEQIQKIKVDAGAFHFSFRKNSNEMTVWVQYPKGTSMITCSAFNKENVELESINIQVPSQEIRNTKNRFTAVIVNDYNLFNNPRYANFILAECDVPTNWYNLIAFDDIVIIDYRNLSWNQLTSIKNYMKSGGVVIIPTRFADADKILQKLEIFTDFSTQDNAVVTLKNQNYILLRSTLNFHAGMIQKYKISDNLNLSEVLEIIRLNQKTQNLPFNLDILRNLAEYTEISTSNYLVNVSDERKNRLVLYISLAMFITMLILIIGLQQFKNLSGIEKQLLIIAFCLIISVVLLFMQDFNAVDSSSFTVILTETAENTPYNVNAKIKLLRINHATTVQFPINNGFIRILSADSASFNEKMDISFDENFYTVKTHGQADLYVAKLDFSDSEKHLSIYESNKKFVVTNLSDCGLQKLVYIDDFKGSTPAAIEKYENLTLDADSIPYRNLFFDYFDQENPTQAQFTNFCTSIIQKNRQFVACYKSTASDNLHIILSPMINQKKLK